VTGKEAFQDVIDFCDFMVDGLRKTGRKDPMTQGEIKGMEIIKAGVERKRDREEDEENVQS